MLSISPSLTKTYIFNSENCQPLKTSKVVLAIFPSQQEGAEPVYGVYNLIRLLSHWV